MSLVALHLMIPIRFNFGSQNAEGDQGRPGAGSGSFLQLLSTTDPNDAWRDFELTIFDLMTENPGQFIDPPYFPIFFPLEFGSANTSDTSRTLRREVGATVFDVVQRAAMADDSSGIVALLDKYGFAVTGLLAGNIALMAIFCMITLVGCTRGTMRTGARTRSIGSTYAPVSYRDKVSTVDDDAEFTVPIRNYSDQ